MKPTEQQLEALAVRALELYEKGTPIREILARFPEHEKELKELFFTTELLERAKYRAMPPHQLLEELLENMPARDVTEHSDARYPLQNHKGRTTIGILEPMQSVWKYVLPLGIVAVIVIAFAVTRPVSAPEKSALSPEEELQSASQEVQTLDEAASAARESLEATASLPPATGNIDDAVDVVFAEIAADQASLSSLDSQADALASSDGQSTNAVSDYGESEL